jgi:putative endonuclease
MFTAAMRTPFRQSFRRRLLRVISPQHVHVGRHGEDIAKTFLQNKGLIIEARNVRAGSHDEIDIVARDPREGIMVFIEVKTRAWVHRDFGPLLNLTWAKRRNMKRAALRWVATNAYDGGWRCDVVCVAGGKVTMHLEDIFAG